MPKLPILLPGIVIRQRFIKPVEIAFGKVEDHIRFYNGSLECWRELERLQNALQSLCFYDKEIVENYVTLEKPKKLQRGDISEPVKYMLWVAAAYMVARIVNNYFNVTKILEPEPKK